MHDSIISTVESFMRLIRAKQHYRQSLGIALSTFFLFISLLSQTVFAVNATFTYDAAGRLLTAQYGDGQHVAYAYDAVGNMTQQVSSGTGGGGLVAAVVQLLLGEFANKNSFSSVLNHE